MTFADIMAVITDIGYPIAVSLICFKIMEKQRESHKAEVDKLAEAVNNNTLVVTRLLEHLTGGTENE